MAKPTINNMAVFCDFENWPSASATPKYAKFDIGKVLERLLLKAASSSRSLLRLGALQRSSRHPCTRPPSS